MRDLRLLALWALTFLTTMEPWAQGAEPAAPKFRAVTIDGQIEIGYGLAIADIDGEGGPDIVVADRHAIVWYRNPDWRKFVMAERLTVEDHVCVAATDIDGDGRAEVAVGAGWNPGDTFTSGALFHLQPGADRTAAWERVRLAHDPTIHRIAWARDAAGAWSLLSLPLHGRGNRNGAGDGVRFLAYHVPSDRRAAWTSSTLNADWHQTHNFDVIVGDQGSAEEVLVAAREGLFRLGARPWNRSASWEATTIATNGPAMPEFVGAGEVRAGRGGASGRYVASVEPMHGNQLVVYVPPPGQGDPAELWGRRVIDSTLVDGHALACADLIGQGRDQIVAGWRAMNRPGTRVGIRLYVAADEALSQWQSYVVDDNEMACEDLKVADVDGDGDLDVVACGRATRNVRIYFNESARR